MKVLAVIALAAALSGCSSNKLAVRVDSTPDTNGGAPFWMVVRSVEPGNYATEGYSAISARVFASPGDPSVLATRVIYPGVVRKVELERPVAQPVGIYFLFTKPGDRWKTTRVQPLPSSVAIELTGNQIKSED